MKHLISALVLFCILAASSRAALADLKAVDGVLDLRDWKPNAQSVESVQGNWLFYWQQQLPAFLEKGEHYPPGTPIPLGQAWRGLTYHGETLSGRGLATYRLTVLAPKTDQPLAIQLPRYRRAYKLWVNGHLLAQSGYEDAGAAQYREQVIPLPENSTTYELILHTRNDLTFSGRSPQPMLIGSLSALESRHTVNLLLVGTTLGAALLFAIRNLILFWWKRRVASYLLLGLLSLNIALGELSWAMAWLGNIFSLPQPSVVRFSILMALGILPLYALLARSRYPNTHSRRLLHWIMIPYVLTLFLTLFGPAIWLEPVFTVMACYWLIQHLLLIYCAWKTVSKYGKRAFLLLMSVLFMTGSALHDVLWNLGLTATQQPLLFNFAVLLLLLVVLFDLYDIEIFHQVRELSRTLKIQVAQRTQELSENVAALQAKEQELQSAYQQVADISTSKTRFLAAASHDLRQPLHLMGLQTEQLRQLLETLLKQRNSESEQVQSTELITQLEQSQITLRDTLNALLDISRLDSGVLEPHYAHFPLQPLFQRIREQFGPLAEQKGVRLRVRNRNIWVHADPVLLYRIVANLVDNAIKYGRPPGVLLAVRQRNERLRIEVCDTGPGLTPQQQQDIFQEYVQLNNSGRDRRKGLGLGLSIIERLCTRLEYPLSLKSHLGKGSCFRVEVPIGSPALALEDRKTSNRERHYSLQGCAVLLVEDDPAILTATKELLASWKCAVLTASSLDEALQVIDGEDVDLIVADYRLADGHTGMEVINAVEQALATVPKAMIVTGEVNPEQLSALRAGQYPVLSKPVEALTLRGAIHHLLVEN